MKDQTSLNPNIVQRWRHYVESPITAHKNEQMPITLTVPTALCVCLYIYNLVINASLPNVALGQLLLLLCIPKVVS